MNTTKVRQGTSELTLGSKHSDETLHVGTFPLVSQETWDGQLCPCPPPNGPFAVKSPGFAKLEVASVDEVGKGALTRTPDCWVESVSPRDGRYADTRKVVMIAADYPLVEKN